MRHDVSEEIFDIREFGAIGNGSHDDAPALQSACNAAAATATPSRAGVVLVPPTQGSWLMGSPVSLSPPGVGNSNTGFEIRGYGCDGPLMIALDGNTDFFTYNAQGEWFQTFLRRLAFLTHDPTNNAYDCRDLLNLSSSGPSTVVIQECWDIGTFAKRTKIHAQVGNYVVRDWHDGGGLANDGVNSHYLIYVDGAANVHIDDMYAFWQGQFRGVSYSNGLYQALVGITPMATGNFNFNNEGTMVACRNLNAFARTAELIECIGDATHIAKGISVEDSFFNCGGNDMFYYDNCRKITLKRINVSNSAACRIDLGNGVLENMIVDSVNGVSGNALQMYVDVNLTGDIRIERSDFTIIRTSGFTPNAGPLTTPVFGNPSGVQGRFRNAAVALAVNLLVKPNGSGSYIKLADGDDGNLATGVSQTSTGANNVIFLSCEQRGQEVTFATDGNAITEGAPLYAAAGAGDGGKVSATAVGKQIGIATAADSANTVTGLFV